MKPPFALPQVLDELLLAPIKRPKVVLQGPITTNEGRREIRRRRMGGEGSGRGLIFQKT